MRRNRSKTDQLLDYIFQTGTEVLIDRCYSPVAHQIGHIFNGYLITRRRRIPKYRRWLHDGKYWEFFGEPLTERDIALEDSLQEIRRLLSQHWQEKEKTDECSK